MTNGKRKDLPYVVSDIDVTHKPIRREEMKTKCPHVPGLELCIALKQLGYPQSSSIFEWRWHEHKKSGAAVWDLHCNYGTPYLSMNHKRYSGRNCFTLLHLSKQQKVRP
jgi:hypothetical protein